jgi:hypothetical protein
VLKYDPIAGTGELVGNRRIPASVSITSKAEALRGVEWMPSKDDIPLYVVITTEKCDGSTTKEVHPMRLRGMIQEDSTLFSAMKAKVTVLMTSSLSDSDRNELTDWGGEPILPMP